MRRLIAVLAALLATGAILAACGGGDDKPLTSDTLAAGMDQVCTDFNPVWDDFGTRGLVNSGIRAEFESTAATRRDFADQLETLEAADSAQENLDAYIAVTRKLADEDEAIAKAAAADDTGAVNKAFGDQTPTFEERDELVEEIGLEVCGAPADAEVIPTETGPADDLAYAEPKNTIEEAADAYVTAATSGYCQKINQQRHADSGAIDEAGCEQISSVIGGAEVLGTEGYGPVGQAEIESKDEVRYPTYFVEDLDGNLRYGGDAIHDSGGLRPAPEGNDAAETIGEAITAIREGDAEAFNAILVNDESPFVVKKDDFAEFGSGDYAESFIGDIREGDGAAEQLGINSTFAFHLFEGSEYDWVVALVHTPGSGKEYRFSGYYPIPKAE